MNKFKDDYNRVLGEMSDLKFKNVNLQRLLEQKNKALEDFNM